MLAHFCFNMRGKIFDVVPEMFVLSVTLYLNIVVKCIINARIDGQLLLKDTPCMCSPSPNVTNMKKKHPLSIKGLFLINIIIQPENLKPRTFTKASTLNVIEFNLYNIGILQDI